MSESEALLRAVVDTNLLVSGLITGRGGPFRLVTAILDETIVLVASPTLLAEYDDVLSRPNLAAQFSVAPTVVDALRRYVQDESELVTPVAALPVGVRDLDDEMVLAAALGGDADYLVTGDQDLLALAGDPRLGRLRIVTVAEFLAILKQERTDDAEAEQSDR